MSERVRVGVIGTGGIALLRHLPAYKACEAAGTAELVAVCDPMIESARSAAERFGVGQVYADYRELLAQPIDAVSICTPNVYHEPITLAAIQAGKHVLCEKPMALTYEGSQRMRDAAHAAGIKTAVNFRYRWIPAAGYAREIIQSGALGEIRHVYANYLNGSMSDPETPLRWRQSRAESGSGVLGDLASHLIDLCRWWFGELASVCGHLRTFVEERPMVGGGRGRVDTEDASSFFARFANGAMGVFNASRASLGRGNHQRIEIYGTTGSIIYEIERWDQGGESLQVCIGAQQATYASFATTRVPPTYLTGTPQHPMYSFVDAIRADTMPSPNFDDGVRCQEVLEAVDCSVAERRWVDLPLPASST